MSFTERMAQGRQVAQDARNRGRHTGTVAKGWKFTRPVANDNWHWIAEQRKEWARQCREIRNHFAAQCLNGPHDDPSTWEL